ncbi:histidine utilization repressor [Kordiimonas sediminis]|uniref:Histidine utilization repressor n=1 Tax=Kordiimonas sediminis TaxID=1735581 RepID=A0A919EBB4_9PROT|nr:histidine utilization repressor [Kordiimonas sediminis]GHF30865.1 histidine utilization repressor [Kordiimonas sediminis]
MHEPMPRYEQVKNFILGEITEGVYAPGDQLPSENDLVKTLGVSRMTVNRALRELVEGGFITRRAGLGSFVSESRMRGQASDIVSIRDELASRGHVWSAKVLQRGTVREGGELALEMGLEETHPVFIAHILHFADGIPFELEERMVNPDIAPDFTLQDFSTITTTEYLLATAPLLTAEHVVRAVLPSSQDSQRLDISAMTPCLEINRKTWTGDRVASVARLLYPGDRYELTTKFNQAGPVGPRG